MNWSIATAHATEMVSISKIVSEPDTTITKAEDEVHYLFQFLVCTFVLYTPLPAGNSTAKKHQTMRPPDEDALLYTCKCVAASLVKTPWKCLGI